MVLPMCSAIRKDIDVQADSPRRLPAASAALLFAALLLVLGGCTHSRIVKRDYESPRRSDAPSSRASSRGVIEPLPRGAVHVVRSGETLYGISFRYGLRYQDVANWNGIGDPYMIKIRQRLRLLPPGGRASDGRVADGRPPPRQAGPTSPSRAPAPTPSRAPAVGIPSVPAAGAPAWRWPTRGQVIGRYVAGDQTQQGINIAGSAGQPVLAAGDGVVVYSGAGLVGYGELIIIKHSDEWLSAYAHNSKRLVAEGARVHVGDTIAEMGHTGASRDMLHFEIRRNGKPVDPLAFLPGQ